MSKPDERFEVLDGWRGLSIICVLATHLLPLGPKAWQLNLTFGPLGMALFFCLSGFLITNFLLRQPSISDFLIRRIARIVPLAWICIAISLFWIGASSDVWLAHLFFYANWPPIPLTDLTFHFWSLCLEMQFYIGIALLYWILKERGLLLLPLFCIGFTAFRIVDGVHVAIDTYYRIDEILAGSTLALIVNNQFGKFLPKLIGNSSFPILLVLFVASCHPASGALNYARPYLAAALVGWTLLNPGSAFSRWHGQRVLAYLATISFALYVLHPLLAYSWLGQGDLFEKYAKRPLLFMVLFLLAHVSTFQFERRCISLGKLCSASVLPRLGKAAKAGALSQ
ncbi:MAG: acyltransferase family protein [Bacteroidota bacterium]